MDEALRAELIACLTAGAAARSAGLDLDDNPHFAALRVGSDSDAQRLQLLRVEAWWDGWAEVDLALTPRRSVEISFIV